jgi:hypothetical protein
LSLALDRVPLGQAGCGYPDLSRLFFSKLWHSSGGGCRIIVLHSANAYSDGANLDRGDDAMQPRAFQDKLTVFISSKMDRKLLPLRSALGQRLREKGIEPYLYEMHEGSGPQPPMQVCIHRVKSLRVYLAILDKVLGRGTLQEFSAASKAQIPRFIYLLGSEESPRNAAVRAFLKRIFREARITVAYKDEERIKEEAADDIWGWLLREYERLKRLDLEQADRLQSVTSRPLGTTLDYLQYQLRALLKGVLNSDLHQFAA